MIPTVERLDEIVARSVREAADDLFYVPRKRPEFLLVAAVRRGLSADPRVRLVDGTPGYALPDWTRPPGGIDACVDLTDGRGRIAMEMKVGKPDESIWDAIKLADIQVFDARVRAGYLISDADWSPGAQGSALFAHRPPRTRSSRALIAESPRAWAGTMIGGRGIRPRASVGGIELTWVTQAPLARHPGRRLIAVRVLPHRGARAETYDEEGFPVGYEPPPGLRAKVRRADEQRAQVALAGPEFGDRTDGCHGYP